MFRPSVAATLLSWGIASFLPQRRGYGNSPGPAWRQDVTAPHGSDDYDAQLVRRLDRESDDVLAGPENQNTPSLTSIGYPSDFGSTLTEDTVLEGLDADACTAGTDVPSRDRRLCSGTRRS